ncbi:cytochrome c oxidase assembly protein [Rhizobium sp. CFBP 8762]|uniref:cytochrome c oxidase assembly protein n=1 Tax=Rhizobium sp. CFBP 8762 TaxID=2775279 RepID=UPI001786A6F3|nr:cytochrome c oxidase assembly protein [Rhizobium sp. CFBP 8762]MBD8556622.1 cytochrome c oxidase assembly protein [Rhizobium sp. CFBP 8762]
MKQIYTPYCGAAPSPDALWSSWNLDPVLLGAFVLAIPLYLMRSRGGTQAQHSAFWVAYGLLALFLISPLCALSSALFSIRVLHHVVLIGFVAPLLAVALRRETDENSANLLPLFFLVHTIIVWMWHAPVFYSMALASTSLFWVMELSLLLSAFFLWRAIFCAAVNPGLALAGLLATVIQMGMLGALLTFTERPMFIEHFLTTDAYGLTAMEDQQLAGLLMWVPAALPYLLAALITVFRLLSDKEPLAGVGNRE